MFQTPYTQFAPLAKPMIFDTTFIEPLQVPIQSVPVPVSVPVPIAVPTFVPVPQYEPVFIPSSPAINFPTTLEEFSFLPPLMSTRYFPMTLRPLNVRTVESQHKESRKEEEQVEQKTESKEEKKQATTGAVIGKIQGKIALVATQVPVSTEQSRKQETVKTTESRKEESSSKQTTAAKEENTTGREQERQVSEEERKQQPQLQQQQQQQQPTTKPALASVENVEGVRKEDKGKPIQQQLQEAMRPEETVGSK